MRTLGLTAAASGTGDSFDDFVSAVRKARPALQGIDNECGRELDGIDVDDFARAPGQGMPPVIFPALLAVGILAYAWLRP